MAWIETESLSFIARHEAEDTDYAQRTLDALEDLRLRLEERFEEVVTDREVGLAGVEEHLAGLRGNELYRGRYYVCATAGTTGRHGVFLWDTSEWVDILSSYNRAYEWGGAMAGLTRRLRTAVVSSTNPSHQSARVGASIHSLWGADAADRLR